MGQKIDEYTKAAIVRAVRGGTVERADACSRYRLSSDELSLWELAFDDQGIAGLRDRRLTVRRRGSQAAQIFSGPKKSHAEARQVRIGRPTQDQRHLIRE